MHQFATPLLPGKILNRYKRFFADVQLDNGEVVVAHCPNTGSMKSCWEPGWNCLVSFKDDPKRKLQYTLEFTHNGLSTIGVNTHLPNKLVKEAIQEKQIPELLDYDEIVSEYKIGQSRIDLLLEKKSGEQCFVEIKNVTLKVGETAMFPDAISERGQKHLNELMALKKAGHRAVLFFLIQRNDVKTFSPADNIDPEYARLLQQAKTQGVEILCYRTHFDMNQWKLFIEQRIPDSISH